MAAAVAAKICGLSDEAAIRAAIEGGAAYLGFVLVPDSGRAVTVDQTLALLRGLPQPTLCRFVQAGNAAVGEGGLVLVALLRDPTDAQVQEALRLKPLVGLIQLHGNETPRRVAAIRKAAGVPVMKAIAVAEKGDLKDVLAYEKVSDMVLFDAKNGTKSGGFGQCFDWSLLQDIKLKKPWMLAGGLTPENVREAISVTGAKIVDVSSGVETRTKKDPDKIRIFLTKLRDL